MLRNVALFLLPIALLVAACGGGSSSLVRDAGDVSVEDVGPAGPDGIYNTADDDVSDGSVVDDLFDFGDTADAPAAFTDDGGFEDDSVASTTSTDDGDDDVVVIADSGSDSEGGSGSLDDNAVLSALNPFAIISGDIPDSFGQGSIDPELGAVLLTAADVPGAVQEMEEFSFSAPSEFGDMAMAARIFSTSDDPDEIGAMIMSAVMTLPPEAMAELDELMGFADADLEEMRQVFGVLQILDATDLGDGGFGVHMEIDFGSLFGAFGVPEDDSVPTGIAMDMYAFAAGDQVLVIMVMWPIGEPPGVDALTLAEIMASRA